MTTLPLELRIGEARLRVSSAEQHLEERMNGLSAASGGETTIVAQLLEGAFRVLREARHELVELTKLLHADQVATLPAQRSCPACAQTIRADARLCGYCWKKLAR